LCVESFAQDPSNVGAVRMLATLISQRGDWQGALAHFERAATLRGNDPMVQNDLGLALSALGRIQDAIQRFRMSIALSPTFADAHCNLGVALDRAGLYDEALRSLDAAVALQPTLARAHSNRGSLQHRRRQLNEALASYDRAIALQPNYSIALAKRGALLLECGRPSEALESCSLAVSSDPQNAIAYVNRSVVFEALGQLEESLEDCDRAVSIQPASAVAHNARGSALVRLGRNDAALGSYQRAMRLDPEYAEAHWNASLCLLRAGRMKEGWGLFEWRKRLPRPIAVRSLDGPAWTGTESLEGRTLFLYAEQGLGDTIQFCRYAALAADAGAGVVIEVPEPLKALARGVKGVAQVVGTGEPPPAFDLCCAMLSLPLAFGTTLENVPACVPYVECDAARLEHWRRRLGEKTRPRVGIAWSSGRRPERPELAATNARRDIPLSQLARLRSPNIEYFSLQKGEAAESELARALESQWDGPVLRDFSAELRDFSDTAALMETLDLVISVDTSTAHLAGALGKPVWILSRFDSCWRWLLERCDSPWYPTARLYRQDKAGDWGGPLERVRNDLFSLVT
jgi:tetratricopeptide (TPR) repeat protein